ncbi:MAG: DUF2510 domain-containing protein [Actinomycetia bacterium]|nr:DUF2510 domain-containing protein [Actinomycetes bacterium]
MAEKEAAWYLDPYGRYQQRYFNGTEWTEHVATGGEQKIDPLGASSVIPIATPPTAFAKGGKAAGVFKFLDTAGPDSRERPQPSLRSAVAGLGGAAVGIGALTVAVGDDPSKSKVIIFSLVVLAAAWALRMVVKLKEVQSAAVGMAVVAIPTFAITATVDKGTGGTATGFVLAALFIAAWALPGFKSRNLLLAFGAIALVFAFGSLTSTDQNRTERCRQYLEDANFDALDSECEGVYLLDEPAADNILPATFTDNAGDQGIIYLVGGALYLGLTLLLDRRGHRGTGTAFAGAGLVSTLVGTGMLVDKFGEQWAPLFVLAVGLVVAFVGSQGERRATTWWGAALTAIATVWFVAVQWEPGTIVAIGGVLIVAGIALVAIPLVDDPIRAALKAGKDKDATPGLPPPTTPAT